MLTHIDLMNEQIAEHDKETKQRLSEESELIEMLDEITGIGRQSAQMIIAEIGTNTE
jgi:transposase